MRGQKDEIVILMKAAATTSSRLCRLSLPLSVSLARSRPFLILFLPLL